MTTRLHVKTDGGAIGNLIANDTAAIQDLIDYGSTLPGGADIETMDDHNVTYRVDELFLKTGVRLLGSSHEGVGTISSLRQLPTIFGADGDAPWIIQTAVGAESATVKGLRIEGVGVGSKQGGVRIDGSSRRCAVSNNLIFNVGRQGILDDNKSEGVVSTNISRFINNLCVNTLLDYENFDDYKGVIELRSSDYVVQEGEYVAGVGRRSESGFAVSCLVGGGGGGRISLSVFELSDAGLVLLAPMGLAVIGVRCDKNYGHGVIINNGKGVLDSLMLIQNSKGLVGQYDAIHATGGSYTVTTPRIWQLEGDKYRHAIYDTQANNDKHNKYVVPDIDAGCCADVPIIGNQYKGAQFVFADGYAKTAANGATVDVNGVNEITLSASNTIPIDNFSNGVSGQVLSVHVEDEGPVINHATGDIRMRGMASRAMTRFENTSFKNRNGVWYETGAHI